MQSELFSLLNEHFIFPFQPYPYQEKAVNGAVHLDNVLLPLKVGRGKTPISTWLGLYHSLVNGVDRMLFVVPASIVIQWSRWLQQIKFIDESSLEVCQYNMGPKQRTDINLKDYDCIVMSPQIFIRDYHKKIAPEFLHDQNLYVVYDESQDGLRNAGNTTWRLFKSFTATKRTVLLSGTPVSTPGDVYAVVKLLAPNIYKNKRDFERKHVVNKDFFGQVTEWGQLDKMYEALYFKAVQIPDSELNELPPVILDLIQYELTPGHLKLYKQLVTEQLLLTDGGELLDATETTRLFHTLQRFITSPGRMDIKRVRTALFQAIWTIYQEDSSKLIIYSNYRDTNNGVLDFIRSKKIKAEGVWGEFTRKKQQRALETFISDPTVKVLVGNPRSLGVGTDGLQQVCYRALFTELPLTPTRFEQAIGRVFRDGQVQPCIVKCLIADKTIQVQLYRALLKKDDLLRQIVGREVALRDILS